MLIFGREGRWPFIPYHNHAKHIFLWKLKPASAVLRIRNSCVNLSYCRIRIC